MTDRTRPLAIVTGADSGIGRATAVALATAGHDLLITYRSDHDGAEETAAEIEAQGATARVERCDQTDPAQVEALFAAAARRAPAVTRWALHAHDTYGLGLANVHAAYRTGVRVFDAAVGGLGGCPFAPRATGNVATEDVLYLLDREGVETGVDLEALSEVARWTADLLGRELPGRVHRAGPFPG